ncbi:hypothetical protein [Lysinibacillus xylanilyticus]|uniref:hypothetical protein n=1 Tax=Lysinibacillus xylanilyticus TaxID=582475 RepID=UPI003CFC0298
MNIKLNETEEFILNEIKNGKTEYIFDKNNDDTSSEIIGGPYFLGSFGYIEYEKHSDETTIGYKNIKLTEKGRHHFMTDKEIREEVSEQVKQMFFNEK